MRYLALATDFDGTLAQDGCVTQATWDSLHRLRESGRQLLLVTGRELDDLQAVCPHLDCFDGVVAENGALLYWPQSRQSLPLAEPPSAIFIEALRRRGVQPLSIGHSIVATRKPQDQVVLEVIRDLALGWQVIFNKESVMVLPANINKASGLDRALGYLGLSWPQTVGIGDAENDIAFLKQCACGVAVANAVPAVRDQADLVTKAPAGAGVRELVQRLLDNDLADFVPARRRLAQHVQSKK